MHKYIKYISLFFLVSCGSKSEKTWTTEDERKYQERLIEVNKDVVSRIQDSIKQFVKQTQYPMKKSGTGLWYHISSKGGTDSIKTGDIVEFSYTISLLNNKLCYSSDSLGLKTIKVGQGGVEAGLEEGILMMCEKDSARFIMPPHLAHGLIGDQNKIPKLAALNYTVVVKKHIKKQ